MSKANKPLDDETDDPRPAHICVVYDPKSGRVVHVHEFIGRRFEREECARMAIDTVAQIGEVKTTGLKVLHPPELKTGPDTTLRVNPKTLAIIAENRPTRRRRASKS
jgi:hypothetical protein